MSTGRATAPRQLMVDVEDPPRNGWQFVPWKFQMQRHRSGPSNDRMPRGATSHPIVLLIFVKKVCCCSTQIINRSYYSDVLA